MTDTEVKLEFRENYAVVHLNRPRQRNAIDMEMMHELNKALRKIKQNNSIRAVVLTGEGEAFCAGGDLGEMDRAGNKYAFLRNLSKSINRNTLEFRNLEIPVIGLVNGTAYGAGFCLVEICDFVIASEDAVFNAGYVNVGLAPGCGSYHLPRLIGLRKAMELMLLAKDFGALKAKEMGLVNFVVPKEKLWDEVEALVEHISSKPRESLKVTKAVLYKSLDADIHAQIENESLAIAEAGLTMDFLEGLDAFLSKRKPEFGKTGKG
ncbi:MAG: enoyl-CoA hydratase/isomerase family protein [Thermoplasmata archaeon]|nr:enoyl-CoA hydratase/isomerase family protein [Thermoplasmata archaeon]